MSNDLYKILENFGNAITKEDAQEEVYKPMSAFQEAMQDVEGKETVSEEEVDEGRFRDEDDYDDFMRNKYGEAPRDYEGDPEGVDEPDPRFTGDNFPKGKVTVRKSQVMPKSYDDVEEAADDKEIEKMPNGQVTVTDKVGDTLTFGDTDTAKEFIDDMDEDAPTIERGDAVQIAKPASNEPGEQKLVGKTGTVTHVSPPYAYVRVKNTGREIEVFQSQLKKLGMMEDFGAYDDMEPVDAAPAVVDYAVNPDLVKFDSGNAEHRERLQRGTKVVLVPVLFQDEAADRSGVLSNIGKSGFFCKVIRNADGQEVNAHMDDIEYADLYNNTVYEEFEKKYRALLDEEVTVTKTENPENPELDTITITGTEGSVAELEALLQNAGVAGGAPAMDEPAEPEMDEPEVELIDTEEEQLMAEYERELRHSNTPDERVAPVQRAYPSGSDLHKEKGAWLDAAGGDNPRAVKKNIGEWGHDQGGDRASDYFKDFDTKRLIAYVKGAADEDIDSALLDYAYSTGDSGAESALRGDSDMQYIWDNYMDYVEDEIYMRQEKQKKAKRGKTHVSQVDSKTIEDDTQKPGAPLDEVDSFLNLYKAFGERGEKRS